MATWLERHLPHFLIIALAGLGGAVVSWVIGQPVFVQGFLILTTGALTTSCGGHLAKKR